MKKNYKKIMAAGLSIAMLCTGTGGGPVYGAEASVDVDETMYVNLDYYGRVGKINVVKGVGLNGHTEFTDYGTYEGVVNMSNSIEPVMGDHTVTWQFPEAGKERFYYKCAVDKQQIILPWDFDVSYKLNGVPTDGDKLAGASGLVEIHVKAVPNDNAGEYYRSNMMLMVAVPVDLIKCYSVEADGSQTQNLGETTAVVFCALPGEEGDYTVRIGTDRFETIGVIMAMVPGTVEDLKHVKDLKEAKDTWQDAGDRLYDSLEQMADSVEHMRDGVDQVREGMDSAESARQKWSNNKDSILSGNDQTLAALTSVSRQMETIIPHLQTAKDSAEVVHQSMGDIVNTLGDMQDPLRKLQTRLNNIKSSTDGLSGNIPELTGLMQELMALDAKLQASEQAYITQMGNVVSGISLLDDEIDEEDFLYSSKSSSHANDSGKKQETGNGGGAGTDASGGNGQGTDADGGNKGDGGGDNSSGDKGNNGSGDQSSGGSGDQGNEGSGNQSDGGSGNQNTGGNGNQSGGSGNQNSEESKDESNGGSGDQNTGGSGNQSNSGNADQGTGGSGSQGNSGNADQSTGGSGNQSSSGSGDQNTGGSGNQSNGGSGDQNTGGSGNQSSSETADQSTGGSGNESKDQSSSGTDSQDTGVSISRGSSKNRGNGGSLESTVSASIVRHNAPFVTAASVPGVSLSTEELLEALNARRNSLGEILKTSSELSVLMSNLMEDTSDSAKYSAELVDNMDYLIEDLTALHDSLDTYYPDLQAALDDSQELVRRTTDALNSGISTMTIIQSTLKDSSDDFDAAARDSLRGSMELLDKSLNILDSTTAMREAGRIMKDTIDNELNKFDTDNRFLFMDPSAEKVSFTSDRNKPPKTLQIIMRTDEISLDDDTAKTADAEVSKVKESPLRRMWNVLVQMWKAMVSIFKNR